MTGWLRWVMALAVAAAMTVVWRTVGVRPDSDSRTPTRALPLPTEAEARALDIEFYERRAAEDAFSAADRSRLAALYLQRARETGSYDDYSRAEAHARRSIAIRSDHNDESFLLLVSTLMARHQLREAAKVARSLHARDTSDAAHTALLAEVELEIGDYAAAASHFEKVTRHVDKISIAARVARWYELTGRSAAARRLLRGTAARLAGRRDVPREQLAWFHYRVGELELRAGRLDAADSAFASALAVFPENFRALGGLSRLAASGGDWERAIDLGSRAIAIQLDPATLGTLSDAYAALGDTAQARQFADVMATAALAEPGPIHRAWGLFLLDRGQETKTILRRARADLAERRDVYGYDLLAWALFKDGRVTDAWAAMQQALSQGTEDAQLHYHAGVIARALGDSAIARQHLERMLSINPWFRPAQPGGPRV